MNRLSDKKTGLINKTIKGVDLVFKTSRELFSPGRIDDGTLAMLSLIEFKKGDKVLDLGCGYGVVGILAAKLIGSENIFMSDIDDTAVNISRENARLNDLSGITILQSDGLRNIKDNDFSLIIINPPYHVDFSVPKHFIEKGFNRLKIDGRLYLVTKRKVWYRNKLIKIFGGVKIWEIDDYYVFMALKENTSYADKTPTKSRK